MSQPKTSSFLAKVKAQITLIRMIQAMLLYGVISLGYVLLAAAQPGPAQKIMSVQKSLRLFKDFEATFPPKPVPPFAISDGQGTERLSDLTAPLAIIQYHPDACAVCAAETASLAAFAQHYSKNDIAVAVLLLKPPSAPSDVTYLQQYTRLSILATGDARFDAYISISGKEPITIIYDLAHGREIGRGVGQINWTNAAARPLFDAILRDLRL